MDPSIPVALITGLFGLLGTMIQYRKAKNARADLRDASEKLDGMTLPPRVGNATRSSIMLLGLGGVGKTSLIRDLFQDGNANPKEKTEDIEIYASRRAYANQGQTQRDCHFYVCDYVGQNLGTLIRAFVIQQKKPYTPMQYGFVNALILMVDLRAPKARREGQEPLPSAKPDEERIQKHLDMWNDQVIDAVSGLLTTDSLKYVALFINKIDLMTDHRQEARDKWKKSFAPLSTLLKSTFPYAEFRVIFGSSGKGNLSSLEEDLIRYSVADDNSNESRPDE